MRRKPNNKYGSLKARAGTAVRVPTRGNEEGEHVSPRHTETETRDAISSEHPTFDAFTPPPSLTYSQPLQPASSNPHHVAARGLWQSMSLHPSLVGASIVTDCMCSAIDVASLGITAPFIWLIAGLFNGVIVFLGQRKWAGDDAESAFIKALIVAFLVALPTPFPAFLTVPSGIVGMVQALRRRS